MSKDLLNNQEMREECMDRIEALEKVKGLLLLPNTEYATTEQVANYYEVGIEAISSLVKDHREELQGNGFRVFKNSDIKVFDLKFFKDFKKNRSVITYIMDDGEELKGEDS